MLARTSPIHNVIRGAADSEAFAVELVAINATMAGCAPAALLLVIAAIEALVRPEFNAIALTTTENNCGHPEGAAWVNPRLSPQPANRLPTVDGRSLYIPRDM